MYTYYITKLTPFTIKKNLISKLKDNFSYKEIEETILLSGKGWYKVKDDSIELYKIINKNSNKVENFLDKYTLLINHTINKKFENISQLPQKYKKINIKKVIFFIKNNSISLEIKILNEKIINICFISTKNEYLNNNYFFKENISLYLKSINI